MRTSADRKFCRWTPVGKHLFGSLRPRPWVLPFGSTVLGRSLHSFSSLTVASRFERETMLTEAQWRAARLGTQPGNRISIDLHGTEASDTACRGATAAHSPLGRHRDFGADDRAASNVGSSTAGFATFSEARFLALVGPRRLVVKTVFRQLTAFGRSLLPVCTTVLSGSPQFFSSLTVATRLAAKPFASKPTSRADLLQYFDHARYSHAQWFGRRRFSKCSLNFTWLPQRR